MSLDYTEDLEEIVEFGLQKIREDETIEVNLKDLLYVYYVLQEYIRFFHQPKYYSKIEDVLDFLGNKHENKAYSILCNAVYRKMQDMFPEDVSKKIEEGEFESPKLPYYCMKG